MDGSGADQGLAETARLLLVERGLLDPGCTPDVEEVGGGISSSLVRLRDPRSKASWCAKRPRVRLRVAGDWQVSQDRSHFEARWLDTVGAWFPDAVPRLVAHDADAHLLIMEDLAPPRWRPWKPDLLDARIVTALGAHLGTLVGAMQARAEAAPALAEDFDAAPLFHALRIRPFLHATAEAHPDRAPHLRELERALVGAPGTLVHGDVSPKNVLVDDDGGLVLLDAECACWGAAHFDPAFLITHLLLKWCHAPDTADAWRAIVESFHGAWLDARGASAGDSVDRHCVGLVPALLLARVDGLSQVDYLSEERAARVRSFARTQLQVRPEALQMLLARWQRAVGNID